MSDFVRVYLDRPWLIPLAVILKPLRLRCFESDQLHHASAFDTPEDMLPSDGLIAIKSKESLLGPLGYRRAGLDLYNPPAQKLSIIGSLLYSDELQTMATVGVIHFNSGTKLRDFQGFITLGHDERYIITSNVRGRLPNPSFVDGISLPNHSVNLLSEAHQARLTNIRRAWGTLTDSQVIEQHIKRLDRNYSYFRELGIYGPLESV